MADGQNSPMCLAELGTRFYERNFGSRFVSHYTRDIAASDWILFPDQFYSSFLLPIKDKSVAIVGNGNVFNHGKLIDSHDVVIRINYPYQWKRDPNHDGEKLTIWAGLGKNEVFKPGQFHNPPNGFDPVDLTSTLCAADSLHCISHHHVQSGFWSDINELNLQKKFQVHWSAPVVFHEIEATPYGEDKFLLAWITDRSYLDSGYGGWFGWDTLLSGVKIVLMAAMSKPAKINIFGMNFYGDGYRTPWDMHKLDVNLDVLRKTIHICRENGIPAEINENS